MFELPRELAVPLSRHVSATRCPAPALAVPALEWAAMASAMATKLPLNMLTPDTGLDYLDT